jgi:hypothetical protein
VELDKIMGVDEASELWKLSPGCIKDLCEEGKIKCRKIGETWIIDKEQPNPSREADESEVIKQKYLEFVQSYLSEEPETEKTELLPNLWIVTNKNHNFYATIECKYRIIDSITLDKVCFAAVTQLDIAGVEIDKVNYLLKIKEDDLKENIFNLTDEQYEMFIETHNFHMQSMNTADKKKYALENVKKVEWDYQEDCLKVSYDDKWWYYDQSCSWY